MSPQIFICGCGAVSPAGWGVEPLLAALSRGEPLPESQLTRPGCAKTLRVRPVPAISSRPAFLSHTRFRRASPISQHSIAAALEALGADLPGPEKAVRLGVVLCVMTGCVNYSRRFYDELLRDPASASPLVFPETVFNAPASHIAAFLGTTALNYTLVGDAGTFLQGLALAADWLTRDEVDGCLVIGAEELDWITAEASRMFSKGMIASAGAGALYLRRNAGKNCRARLGFITEPHLFSNGQTRAQAAASARAEVETWYVQKGVGPTLGAAMSTFRGGIEFPGRSALTGVTAPEDGRTPVIAEASQDLLCDGLQGVTVFDEAEAAAWRDWQGPRLSPKRILGEGSVAAAAWQCVVVIEGLQEATRAVVSVVGSNEQAIAAQFLRPIESLFSQV